MIFCLILVERESKRERARFTLLFATGDEQVVFRDQVVLRSHVSAASCKLQGNDRFRTCALDR